MTTIFWPFVRMVVNTPYDHLVTTGLYASLSKFANDGHRFTMLQTTLPGISPEAKLPPGITRSHDSYIMRDAHALFIETAELYASQPFASFAHRNLIERCVEIMHRIGNRQSQTESLDAYMAGLSI